MICRIFDLHVSNSINKNSSRSAKHSVDLAIISAVDDVVLNTSILARLNILVYMHNELIKALS